MITIHLQAMNMGNTETKEVIGHRLDSWAFLLMTELFERTNQIVASPITPAAH